MQRRSTLWFILAVAWFVLLVLNMMTHHHDLNTLIIAIAVAVFLIIGLLFRSREAKVLRNRKVR